MIELPSKKGVVVMDKFFREILKRDAGFFEVTKDTNETIWIRIVSQIHMSDKTKEKEGVCYENKN